MHTQNQRNFRSGSMLAAALLALGLSACGERVDTAGTPATAPAAAAAPQPTMGERVDNAVAKTERRIDDAAITASVNASLAKDPDLSAVKIDVDTKSGVVTLTGPAPTAAAKDRATSLAQAVDGVAGVNNNLEVRAG